MGKHFWTNGSGRLRSVFAAAVLGGALLFGTAYETHRNADLVLEVAAENGFTAGVEPAIWLGADSASQNNALESAAARGDNGTVQRLLKNGADIHAKNDRALFSATLSGHTETVRLLLDHGANVNAPAVMPPLVWAAAYGHTETVALLLERGADVHALGDQALYSARRNGHEQIVEMLSGSNAPEARQFSALHPPKNHG